MPTLQQLASEGAYARRVRSVFPALTYPAHTTLVTGALPARHGVCHNRPFESGGQSGRWLWEASHIRVPTLWEAVRAAGGRTATVSCPVTVGAEIDWNLPDVRPLDGSDPMAPIREATTPPELFEELEREATGVLRGENFSIARLAREDRVGAIAAYLFERYRPALLLVHCIGTDHVQHQLGRDNPMTRRAVGAADRAIGQVLESVERLGLRDRTAFVLTGDHGSAGIHSQLRPNVWLAAARAREVVESQPPGIRGLVRVVTREELDVLGADPAASFALCATLGIEIHEASSAPELVPRVGAAHGYLPDEPAMHTGFVAAGAGIRSGAVAPEFRLEQIAPLVAALLSLDFDAPDGALLPGLLAT